MGDASMSQQAPMPTPDMNGSAPDTNMGGEMPIDNDNADLNPDMGSDMGQSMDGGNPDKQKKEIQKNIGKACDDFRNYQGQDKADLAKWIDGMLDSLDGEDDENTDFSDSADGIEQAPQQMPMESAILNKKKINEVFGIDNLSPEKEEPKNEKRKNNSVKDTPFNNPTLWQMK